MRRWATWFCVGLLSIIVVPVGFANDLTSAPVVLDPPVTVFEFCCVDGQCSDEVAQMDNLLQEKLRTSYPDFIVFYVVGEGAMVPASCQKCTQDDDPEKCLVNLYQKWDKVASGPQYRYLHGGNPPLIYDRHWFFGPDYFDVIEFDVRLKNYPQVYQEIQTTLQLAFAANELYQPTEQCNDCSRLSLREWKFGYASKRLWIVPVILSERERAKPDISIDSTRFYDAASDEDIGFTGLFDPNLWPDAKEKIISAMLEELKNLEVDQQARYTDLEQRLRNWSNEEWNQIWLEPDTTGGDGSGKITQFRVQLDDNDLGPIDVYPGNDLPFPSSAFNFALKAKFRDDFE